MAAKNLKNEMLGKLEPMSAARRKHGSDLPAIHNYAQGHQFKDHHLHLAGEIIRRGIAHFGLSVDSRDGGPVPKMLRGSLSAVAIAWSICRYTTMPRRWTAEQLRLDSAGKIGERVHQFELVEPSMLAK